MGVFLAHRRANVLLSHVPDAIDVRDELWRTLDRKRARSRQFDIDSLLYATWPSREHQHPVGQEHCLVDLVGDEQYGLAALLPDAQQLRLHDLAGLRIK